MKNISFIAVVVVFFGLFATSCEKEHMCHPLPGTTHEQGDLKDGEAGDDTMGDDDDEPDDEGITDGGRDEDYDKSGKKKPKQ
jgi:hypothetical protein